MQKSRLDVLLVERGLADTRAKAQALIMAGEVRVDGEVALKPGAIIETDRRLEVQRGARFVSRGGEKLDAALEAFNIDVGGCVCADIGASTGGFTDCLLQRGAAKVYAIDVGKGILDWKLRNDPRIVVMEATNARYVESLSESISLVTIDASFISLRILLPVARNWLRTGSLEAAAGSGGGIVALIKPQFEAGRQDAARGAGVIRSPEIHRKVLLEVLGFAQSIGLGVHGLMRSPLLGPKGNIEFLTWLHPSSRSLLIEQFIEEVIASSAKPSE